MAAGRADSTQEDDLKQLLKVAPPIRQFWKILDNNLAKMGLKVKKKLAMKSSKEAADQFSASQFKGVDFLLSLSSLVRLRDSELQAIEASLTFIEIFRERVFKPCLSTIISEISRVAIVAPSDPVQIAAKMMRELKVNSVLVMAGNNILITHLLRYTLLNCGPKRPTGSDY